MRRPSRITRHAITDEWSVMIDSKRYEVTRRAVRRPSGEPVYGEPVWSVTSIPHGSNGYVRYCDPEGQTHKRVVAWVKQAIAPPPGTKEAA